MKKIVRNITILVLMCMGFITFNLLWDIVDPFNKRTDTAPLVYILNNSYHINRNTDKLSIDVIGEQTRTVKRKTLFSPNKNGESNHLEKGIKLFEIIDVDNMIKIGVLYEDKYYEYIDAPWD